MRKIKVIQSRSESWVENDVQNFMNSEEAQGINVISVNGIADNEGYIVTYILYEDKQKNISLNS